MKEKYEKRIRPLPSPNSSTRVEVSGYILQLEDIHDEDGYFTMKMYFRQQWVDSRMGRWVFGLFHDTSPFWTPDTYIVGTIPSNTFGPQQFYNIIRENFQLSQVVHVKILCDFHLVTGDCHLSDENIQRMKVCSCPIKIKTVASSTAEM